MKGEAPGTDATPCNSAGKGHAGAENVEGVLAERPETKDWWTRTAALQGG